jgi:hypothetical protein
MADQNEVAAMAHNVVADDTTLALLVDLRKMGDTGGQAADLIEWFIDQSAQTGDEYVVRADKDDPVGVIYTGTVMIGAVVRMCPTGRTVPA